MTPARMRRIWQARGGLCGICRTPVDERGPNVRYDHYSPIWISGSDADEGIWPIHRDPCDIAKTAKDQGDIAKIKRLIADREGTAKPKRKIASRGFDKSRSRGFDGKVRPRH